jgi:GNAT superfamily N-acetyltransferase
MIRSLHQPEQILSLTRKASEAFFAESGVPGTFDFEGYCQRMGKMIELDIGIELAYISNYEALGIIGGSIFPDIFTGDLVCVEMFWYVLPEHRCSPIGIRLLYALEEAAIQRGCKRLFVGNLASLNDAKMEELYTRMNYRKIETHYCKLLNQHEARSTSISRQREERAEVC